MTKSAANWPSAKKVNSASMTIKSAITVISATYFVQTFFVTLGLGQLELSIEDIFS